MAVKIAVGIIFAHLDIGTLAETVGVMKFITYQGGEILK